GVRARLREHREQARSPLGTLVESPEVLTARKPQLRLPRPPLVADVEARALGVPGARHGVALEGELARVELARVLELVRETGALAVARKHLAASSVHARPVRDVDEDAIAVGRQLAVDALVEVAADAHAVLDLGPFQLANGRQLRRVLRGVALEERNVG